VADFREHLPEGCPPKEAEPADGGIFYRLVIAEALDHRAFLSEQERGLTCPAHDKACQWAGVSLCRTRDDIEVPRKISPRKFAKARIARGTLTADLGVTQHTPRVKFQSHTTYWPFESAEPWRYFEIESEDEGNG
jgi:hypothetical protein